jgi:hypothetical protein
MHYVMTRIGTLRDRGAECRGDRVVRGTALLLAVLLVVVGILDVISTNASLAAGNAEENPLVAALQRGWGVWWFVPKLAVHVALATLVLWLPSRGMLRKAGAGIALYAVIIAGNFHVAGWTV